MFKSININNKMKFVSFTHFKVILFIHFKIIRDFCKSFHTKKILFKKREFFLSAELRYNDISRT